jgi:hypothetical protein
MPLNTPVPIESKIKTQMTPPGINVKRPTPRSSQTAKVMARVIRKTAVPGLMGLLIT